MQRSIAKCNTIIGCFAPMTPRNRATIVSKFLYTVPLRQLKLFPSREKVGQLPTSSTRDSFIIFLLSEALTINTRRAERNASFSGEVITKNRMAYISGRCVIETERCPERKYFLSNK